MAPAKKIPNRPTWNNGQYRLSLIGSAAQQINRLNELRPNQSQPI